MIPLSRPLLPTYDKLEPYLRQIDSNRYYSNTGPLCMEYERCLSEHFGAYIASASSATSALTASVMALDLKPDSFIATPSWSFVSTAAAIVAAGHRPYFMDVKADTWVMDGIIPSEVSAALWVAPFGHSLDFTCFGNLPIIIDAAAGFDTVVVSNIPTIVSSHATKAFSTGEGGMVICKDSAFIEKVRTIMSIGISKDRSVNAIGINAKLSEYHAAIGLAELDGWEEKRQKWIEIQEWYNAPPIAISTHIAKHLVSSSISSRIYSGAGIETRKRWYGIADLPAYKHFPRTKLPVTEDLIDTTIGLPCFLDITKEQVDYIRGVML